MAQNDRKSSRIRPLAALVLLLAVAAGGGVYWLRYATYHLAEVQPGVLYRDGNRSMREFANACRRSGIRTIVMLIDNQEVQREPFKTELEFCDKSGIRLERIPVTVGQRPDTEAVQRFLKIVSDPSAQPVLVHCAQGVRRTGMMVAAYQRSILNYDVQKTKDAIMLWGRKPPSLDDVRGFIDDYDPQSRTVGSAHIVHREQDRD